MIAVPIVQLSPRPPEFALAKSGIVPILDGRPETIVYLKLKHG